MQVPYLIHLLARRHWRWFSGAGEGEAAVFLDRTPRESRLPRCFAGEATQKVDGVVGIFGGMRGNRRHKS